MAQYQSLYPAQLDTNANHSPNLGFDTDWQSEDIFTSTFLDLLSDAILAIETELGTDPAGASTDIKTLLAGVTAAEMGQVANIGATTISADQWSWLGNMNQSRARAYLNSDQLNLVNSTATKITLDTENYDNLGEFDSTTNYRFTATIAGYYQVNAEVGWLGTSIVADKRYEAYITRDGANVVSGNATPSGALYFSVAVSDIIYLAAGQYLELWAVSYAGVDTVDVWGGTQNTFMSVHRLS